MVLDFFRPRSGVGNVRLAGATLSRNFFVVAAVVVGAAMLAFGAMMTSVLQESVLRTAGDEWAAFLGAFLEPHIQDLAPGQNLSPAQVASLDATFSGSRLSHTLVAVKIWSTEGKLLYGTNGADVGESELPGEVAIAASGRNVVQIEQPEAGLRPGEPGATTLIEVYAPLHHVGSNRVIAVGELYEDATNLVREVDSVRLLTWAAVAVTSILVTGVLYLIVLRAARTIDRQQVDLNTRVVEAARLAAQNNDLRLAADKARLDASEANEQLLDRIGADLHDGPVQLLSLVALSLSSKRRRRRTNSEGEPDELRILGEALIELRNISVGLSLPELAQIGLPQALELAVFRHEDLTGDRIVARWGDLPQHASEALKICAYRVLQEGMANAHKHARGATIEITARHQGNSIHLEIADTGGPELSDTAADPGAQKLGLAGMRNRVTSLNGTLKVVPLRPRGMRVSVRLPLHAARPQMPAAQMRVPVVRGTARDRRS